MVGRMEAVGCGRKLVCKRPGNRRSHWRMVYRNFYRSENVAVSNSACVILPFFSFFASLSSSANKAQSSSDSTESSFFSSLSARVRLRVERSSHREADAINTLFFAFCERRFSLASFLASFLLQGIRSFVLVEDGFERWLCWAFEFNRLIS